MRAIIFPAIITLTAILFLAGAVEASSHNPFASGTLTQVNFNVGGGPLPPEGLANQLVNITDRNLGTEEQWINNDGNSAQQPIEGGAAGGARCASRGGSYLQIALASPEEIANVSMVVRTDSATVHPCANVTAFRGSHEYELGTHFLLNAAQQHVFFNTPINSTIDGIRIYVGGENIFNSIIIAEVDAVFGNATVPAKPTKWNATNYGTDLLNPNGRFDKADSRDHSGNGNMTLRDAAYDIDNSTHVIYGPVTQAGRVCSTQTTDYTEIFPQVAGTVNATTFDFEGIVGNLCMRLEFSNDNFSTSTLIWQVNAAPSVRTVFIDEFDGFDFTNPGGSFGTPTGSSARLFIKNQDGSETVKIREFRFHTEDSLSRPSFRAFETAGATGYNVFSSVSNAAAATGDLNGTADWVYEGSFAHGGFLDLFNDSWVRIVAFNDVGLSEPSDPQFVTGAPPIPPPNPFAGATLTRHGFNQAGPEGAGPLENITDRDFDTEIQWISNDGESAQQPIEGGAAGGARCASRGGSYIQIALPEPANIANVSMVVRTDSVANHPCTNLTAFRGSHEYDLGTRFLLTGDQQHNFFNTPVNFTIDGIRVYVGGENQFNSMIVAEIDGIVGNATVPAKPVRWEASNYGLDLLNPNGRFNKADSTDPQIPGGGNMTLRDAAYDIDDSTHVIYGAVPVNNRPCATQTDDYAEIFPQTAGTVNATTIDLEGIVGSLCMRLEFSNNNFATSSLIWQRDAGTRQTFTDEFGGFVFSNPGGSRENPSGSSARLFISNTDGLELAKIREFRFHVQDETTRPSFRAFETSGATGYNVFSSVSNAAAATGDLNGTADWIYQGSFTHSGLLDITNDSWVRIVAFNDVGLSEPSDAQFVAGTSEFIPPRTDLTGEDGIIFGPPEDGKTPQETLADNLGIPVDVAPTFMGILFVTILTVGSGILFGAGGIIIGILGASAVAVAMGLMPVWIVILLLVIALAMVLASRPRRE